MPTAEKQATIEAFTESLKGATSVVVTKNAGLNAEEVTELRKAVRASGLTLKVVKNTFAIRASKAAGIEGLDQYLSGPTMITISKGDIVAPAKVLSKFAKEHEKLTIVGGVIDGKPANPAEVETFASLPSKEEVVAMLLRTINGPVSGLARVVNAWVEKRQAAEGGAPAA
jgi:large subunit ribosomal protein L10